MEFYEVIKARKSVRAYEDRPVGDDVLQRVLEAARLSPSAKNLQPWHFVVVRDPERREALSGGLWGRFLKEAPVVIVGCGNRKESKHWCKVDTTIALQTLVLAATAEGLGTCWVGDFREEKAKALLGIPDDYEIVCMIAMGHERRRADLARAAAGGARRKDMASIVSYDGFGRR